jgi:hypothetical protein
MQYRPSILAPTLALAIACLFTGCASKAPARSVMSGTGFTATSIEAVYTVQAEDKRALVRAITRATRCPRVQWDSAAPAPMQVRAAPAVVPVRAESAQKVSKEAAFPVLTCEASWPPGVRSARVLAVGEVPHPVPAPVAQIQRIVIVADTGCRLKASEDAYQDCNDASNWPFAQIATSAAATKPDLVVHIGDIHYRESPCPVGRAGCAASPWGFGYDTWQADLFQPAKPLLAAAPWLFVRGNHESCSRAGQGWFRFVDSQPWSEARACNLPSLDREADFSQPFAVPIGPTAQFLVFDSSQTPGKALDPKDNAYAKYVSQMGQIAKLAQARPNSYFLSHHPVLGFAPASDARQVKPGNQGLQSAFSALQPERLFPAGVELVLHGHVHLFEAISFSSNHPATLVMGNSGSQNEGGLPAQLPPGAQPYKGAVVEDFATQSEYGFATLDRVAGKDDTYWLLTEYRADGQPTVRCDIVASKSRCKRF